MELYSEYFQAQRRFAIQTGQKRKSKNDILKEIPFRRDVIETCEKICCVMFNCNVFKIMDICIYFASFIPSFFFQNNSFFIFSWRSKSNCQID